jgi:hypothetical protein
MHYCIYSITEGEDWRTIERRIGGYRGTIEHREINRGKARQRHRSNALENRKKRKSRGEHRD